MSAPSKILVLYYTQSGQMRQVAESFCTPFIADSRYTVVYEEIQASVPFPFPWSGYRFFDAFPETFHQKPISLAPFSQNIKGNYDLIVLAYQPWFLTPSPVISSFLQCDEARHLIGGKPVVTLIACRNMWLGAQEKVKQHLSRIDGNLIANIALVDKAPNVVSLMTITRWLLWGRKERSRWLPAAGVADADIARAVEYGQMVREAITTHNTDSLQQQLADSGAVDIVPELVLMEARGQRAFGIWARFIGSAPRGTVSRSIRLYIFMTLLPTAIVILSPLLALISYLMLKLNKEKLIAKVKYFKMNELSTKDIWRS